MSALTAPQPGPNSSALRWYATTPDGRRVALSGAQLATLWYARARIARSRGPFTLRTAAAALATDPGSVRHRLRRLRALGLLGYRAVRGRHGRALVWLPRPESIRRNRLAWARRFGNVATSTPFGGYISARELTARLPGYVERRRRLSPSRIRWAPDSAGALPRWVGERCRCGRPCRAERRASMDDGARLRARYGSACPSCGELVAVTVDVELGAAFRRPPYPVRSAAVPRLVSVGAIAATLWRGLSG